MPARRPYFFLGPNPRDHAFAAPNLNHDPGEKLFCLFNRIGVVSAYQRRRPDEVTVRSNGVRPVLCHPRLPSLRVFGGLLPWWAATPIIKLVRCLFGPGPKNKLGQGNGLASLSAL